MVDWVDELAKFCTSLVDAVLVWQVAGAFDAWVTEDRDRCAKDNAVELCASGLGRIVIDLESTYTSENENIKGGTGRDASDCLWSVMKIGLNGLLGGLKTGDAWVDNDESVADISLFRKWVDNWDKDDSCDVDVWTESLLLLRNKGRGCVTVAAWMDGPGVLTIGDSSTLVEGANAVELYLEFSKRQYTKRCGKMSPAERSVNNTALVVLRTLFAALEGTPGDARTAHSQKTDRLLGLAASALGPGETLSANAGA